MVLEVLANTRKIDAHINASSLKNLLGADTAQLQEVRGVNGTSREDDLLLCVDGDQGVVSRREDDASSSEVVVNYQLASLGVEQKVVVGAGSVDAEVVAGTSVRASDSPGVHQRGEPEDTGLSGTTVGRELNAVDLLERFHQRLHAGVVEARPASIDLRRITPVGGIVLEAVEVVGQLGSGLGKVEALS